MRKDPLFITAILMAFLFSSSEMMANHLDGLWQNNRQNITIRIEHDGNTLRAKRIDQATWYHYQRQGDNEYIDRDGNSYKIMDEDKLVWNESRTGNRIIFIRVDSPGTEHETDEASSERNEYPHDRTNRNQWETQDRSRIEGRWYDRSTKERLIIEAINNGYRVRTQHGGWEQFASDRNGKRLRSRSGDIIQLIDSNKLRLISDRGRHESIFIRQGNGHHNDKARHNDKVHKNRGHMDKGHKSDHKGKSCCG